MADPALIEEFEKIFCNDNNNVGSHLGKIEHPDAEANAPGCRGERDYLFVYLRVSGRKIVDIKYECSQCDPGMFVTGEILCELVKGLSIDEVEEIDERDFIDHFGRDCEELEERASTALLIIKSAIGKYGPNPQENILEHYNNPKNWGLMEEPDKRGYAENPSCGDMIEIGLSLDDQRIGEARFMGKGCVISLASASMLVEFVQGKTLKETKKIAEKDIIDLLGTNITLGRRKCAFVALRALRQALA
jgi:nitrogen fixation protein NifU and related proteins